MTAQEILQLTEKVNTPFYHYDTEVLKHTLKAINNEISNCENFHVHYAIKANANPQLLSVINEAGLGADCVSGGEISISLKAGFPPSKIVFAGVGKTDEEIRLALESGISCFNVESLAELYIIEELAKELGKVANIAFRINPNIDAHTHEKITTGLDENKFGINYGQTLEVIKKSQNLTAINYTGLHFHIGSQITDLGVYRELCKQINRLLDHLEENGIVTQSINVGGGLGIDYHNPDQNPIPDFTSYFDIFKTELKYRPNQEVHFELGRSIIAQCGSLITKVLYIKEGVSKNFIIVDAGMTDLIRPAMYGAYHKIQNLTALKTDRTETDLYDIVGPICESSDVFIKEETFPITRRGDILAIRSAGAYGETMSSTYNQRRLPKSIVS